MIQADSNQAAPAANSQAPSLGQKLLLLLFAGFFCLIFFLALDGVYSHFSRKSSVPTPAELFGCLGRDRLRVLALQPNCSTIRAWGRERYQLNVNSQGFRDEKVRQVPLTDPRPRILMLGDSFTESMGPWNTSFVGRIASRFPQYEILNGGVGGYSPSNYLNTERIALKSGLDFDEAIVFIDISDVQDEAALVHDIDDSGAVALARHQYHYQTWYSNLRSFVSKYFVLTNYIWEFVERTLVRFGFYHLDHGFNGNVFDLERSGWTYRKVVEDQPFELGFAPLGVEAGIAKEKMKMDLLWEDLAKRNIPISVVVYPWPAHADLRQCRLARGEHLAGLVRRKMQALHHRVPGVLRGQRTVSQVSAGMLVFEGLCLRGHSPERRGEQDRRGCGEQESGTDAAGKACAYASLSISVGKSWL